VLEELESAGMETELIQLGGRKVFGCLACGKCFSMKNNRCARKDDEMNDDSSRLSYGKHEGKARRQK